MKKIIILAAGALALTACGKNIRPDPTPYPAINSNYPSAEFRAAGETWVGLGYAYLEPEQKYDDARFKIAGYYRGTIRVVSEACEIDTTFRYEGTGMVSVFLPGLARKSCLISFVVSPEFPDQDDQAVVIHSLKGHLYLKVGASAPWSAGIEKVPRGAEKYLKIAYDADDVPNVVVRGCNAQVDRKIAPVDGYIELPVSELGNGEVRSCIYQGLIEGDTERRQFSYLVWFYDEAYQRLSKPAWSINGSKLKVRADKAVTLVALDGVYELDREASFEFDRYKTHLLRVGTVAGRTLLGTWVPETGVFKWKD